MTTSSPVNEIPASPVVPPHGAGLAELALAVGGLALGTGEFASMSILPMVSTGLHTPLASMGHMISAYALGVVFGAPLITIFLARLPRRAMLIGLMAMFAVGNALSAMAPGYAALVIARFVAGIPHGAYFGVASLVAASLVSPDRRGQAVSRVLAGLTVANVIGVPLATWLGQALGWRATFVCVAALGVLTASMVRVFLPPIASGGASPRSELSVFGRLQVWLTLAMVAIGFGGLFCVYTYVTPTLLEVTHVRASLVPLFLTMIGLGMTVGNLAGGWLADRSRLWTIGGVLVWNALALSAFAFASANPWTAALDLFLIGAGIAVAPAVQTRLMDVAGDAQSVAAALNHSAFNIANALGAWLGGVAISFNLGLTSTAWVGALLALVGLLALGVSVAVERHQGARPPGLLSSQTGK
jgi:DHA1 family inner membrane transport protein